MLNGLILIQLILDYSKQNISCRDWLKPEDKVYFQAINVKSNDLTLGITDKTTLSSLLGLDLSNSAGRDYAIDIRDSAIQWVNDIETDKQYRRWSSSVMELLRPTFPGMLRSVRKNLYNLVRSSILLLGWPTLASSLYS